MKSPLVSISKLLQSWTQTLTEKIMNHPKLSTFSSVNPDNLTRPSYFLQSSQETWEAVNWMVKPPTPSWPRFRKKHICSESLDWQRILCTAALAVNTVCLPLLAWSLTSNFHNFLGWGVTMDGRHTNAPKQLWGITLTPVSTPQFLVRDGSREVSATACRCIH